MKTHEDIILLDRLKSGDVDAYEQLFIKYYKLLNIEAFALLEDEMEAEDQVQSLFVEIWHKQLYLHINSSLKAYLQKAIHNRCLKVIKKRKTAYRKFGEYTYSIDYKTEENYAEQREIELNVSSLLSELPIQRSQAFNLVYIENKKYKEAADEMGISINSIKTHLKLAIKTLRSRFVIK
jgi:RNA polymerase sigma-70 factor (ECF subfamily)